MTAAFKGFPEEGIRHLLDLEENNDRAWFNANKAIFESQLMAPARLLCHELEGFVGKLTGTAYTTKSYRMHRGLRCSADCVFVGYAPWRACGLGQRVGSIALIKSPSDGQPWSGERGITNACLDLRGCRRQDRGAMRYYSVRQLLGSVDEVDSQII